jgi:hypothetical protein
MVQIKTLLPELRKLVAELAEDLLARATSDVAIDAGLREAFHQIEEGGRTAQAYEVWREDYLDQVAVAWVLACVFVRFMEDNGLIDECWLAGEGARRKLAEDTHELFFREHPHDTDREYFQHVFHEVGKIPAAADLFAEGKTPLWAVAPSGDAAMKLLKFWREMDAATGHLKRSFQVESGDTRFLGDLYQELSERAKKKFALLQTPVFVEEFILDRTLTPAVAEFGLEKVRMIDPTCGSGHFLLGGFARLFDLWSRPEHTTGNAETDAQKALDGVWGVDRQYSSRLPAPVVEQSLPSSDQLAKAHTEAITIRRKMISLQEELDWQSYRLYGLLSEDVCYGGNDLPELSLGERAFEIVMARRIKEGILSTKWFEWLHITPITEIPAQWPASYRKLVERRIKLIEENKEIALIEKPDCKRRWESEPWEEQQQRALKIWLLDKLESPKFHKGTKDHLELTTTAHIADVASTDAEYLQVAAIYRGRSDYDLPALVAELVEAEAVPLLPMLRYKPAGLRKRELWERTWDLQRQQDAGIDVGEIPVPPKYATADFLKTDFWRLRGKLDVPKERWISFPHCSTEGDPTLVVGWAGWNHLEQATALVAYYDARKREGWDASATLSPLPRLRGRGIG